MRFYEIGPGGGRPCPKGTGGTRSVSEHLFIPHRPAGTHAYLVSHSGAKKLMERFPLARYHVDLVAWGFQDLKLYAANPFLASQLFDDETSTVASDFSRSQKIMMWCWKVSGLQAMGKKGGVTNVTWAWRTALFAVPIFPWRKWPNNLRAASQGPLTSLFVIFLILGPVTMSTIPIGLGIAYLCAVCTFLRVLSGTFKLRFFLALNGIAAGLIAFGLRVI